MLKIDWAGSAGLESHLPVAPVATPLDEIPTDSQCLAFRRARMERR